MAWDFAFDADTHDTIPDGKGSIALTDGSETMVELQFSIDFASWWGDPEAGFQKNLKAYSSNPGPSVQAEAQRALGVLSGRGAISNASAIAQETSPGRVVLNTSSRDTRTGRTIKVSR